MNAAQKAERGRNARNALEFLEPAFEGLKADYMASMARVAAVVPLKVDTIQALAQAVRIVDVVKAQIEAIVVDGEKALKEIEHGRKVVEMTASDRRLLDIAARR